MSATFLDELCACFIILLALVRSTPSSHKLEILLSIEEIASTSQTLNASSYTEKTDEFLAFWRKTSLDIAALAN